MSVLLALALAAAAAGDLATDLLAQAEAAIARGDLAAAGRALDEALAVDADDVDALYAAAQVARLAGRDDALVFLARLVQLDPAADDARLELALALWEKGETASAAEAVAAVLARHPELPEALALEQRLQGGGPARRSPWRLRARLDLAAGYDSNLTLASTALPDVARQAAALAVVDVAVGASYHATAQPFSAFVRLSSLQPLNHRDAAASSAATLVGLALVGRRTLGAVESVLDLRYDEIFTDSFGRHRQRMVSPSLYGAVDLGAAHRVRLLAGADYRQSLAGPSALGGGDIEPSSMVARASLRDTLPAGRWLFALELQGRRAFAVEEAGLPGASREVDFLELGVQGHATARVTDAVSAFALAAGARRAFDAARPAERTLHGELGVTASFDRFELHGEYALTRNDSAAPAWRWTRHTVFAGVRAYIP